MKCLCSQYHKPDKKGKMFFKCFQRERSVFKLEKRMLPDSASPTELRLRTSTLLHCHMEQMLLLLLHGGSPEINSFHVQIILWHYMICVFNTH